MANADNASDAGDGEIIEELRDDHQVIGANNKAQKSDNGSSESDHEVSDSAEADSSINSDDDHGANKIFNPLALKPVFVSKVDREMLDPQLQ